VGERADHGIHDVGTTNALARIDHVVRESKRIRQLEDLDSSAVLLPPTPQSEDRRPGDRAIVRIQENANVARRRGRHDRRSSGGEAKSQNLADAMSAPAELAIGLSSVARVSVGDFGKSERDGHHRHLEGPRHVRHADQWRDDDDPTDVATALGDPRGHRSASAQSDDDYRIAETATDVDRSVGGVAQRISGESGKRGWVASAFRVIGKPRDIHVVALVIKNIGERVELVRRIRKAVEKDDRSRGRMSVSEDDRSAIGRRDAIIGSLLPHRRREG